MKAGINGSILDYESQNSTGPLIPYEGNHYQITALAHHDELNLLAAGTHGAAINVYNLHTNEKPIWLPGHREPITKLDFLSSELGKTIIDSNQLRVGFDWLSNRKGS